MATKDAVAHGLRATAGVVTSAAVIVVAVFAVFGTLSMQDFKQLGVGLGVVILLDAPVIGVLLLPAVMTLLGERNWPRAWRRLATAEPRAEADPADRLIGAGDVRQAWPVAAAGRQRLSRRCRCAVSGDRPQESLPTCYQAGHGSADGSSHAWACPGTGHSAAE